MPETWGLLEKSQVDPEKIEEAIARLILVHNEDETAHLGAGQSLQSHKASEIIDHVVDSIIADKIKDREVPITKLEDFSWERHSLSIESLDGWIKSASGVAIAVGDLTLATGPVANTEELAYAQGGVVAKWSKKIIAQYVFRLISTTNQIAYIVTGTVVEAFVKDQCIGFKIVNGILYASWKYYYSGSVYESNVEISGIDFTDFHIYRVEFIPGVSIKWYIDDVLKYTTTDELPDPTYDGEGMFDLKIKNTATENKVLIIRQLYFAQER